MAVYRYGKKTSDINVQSDFSVKDLNNDAYIKNRPDSTLSISLDGVEQEKQYNPNTGDENINIDLTKVLENQDDKLKEKIESLQVPSIGGEDSYISQISETDGKISATAIKTSSTIVNDSKVAVNSIAVSSAISTEVTNRNTAISTAINNLNVAEVGESGSYIKTIKENNGVITATSQTFDTSISKTSTDLNAPSSKAVYNAIQSLGNVYRIKDSVETFSKLPSTNNTAGDVRNVNDTSDNYVWTGTKWDPLGGSNLIDALNASSPTASGTSTSFITSVSQTQGLISATKANLPTSSTTVAGIVKLNNSVSSNSTSEAATANAVKTVQDALNTEITNRKNAISALDATVSGTPGAGKTLTAFSETDGKVSATFGNIAITQSQVNGLVDALAGKQDSGNYKTVQSAVLSPTASGNTTSFIDTISQDTNGKITATKKTVTAASTSVSGLMSSTDKTKLDGIESGAQVNTVTGVKGNSETSYRTGNINITKGNIGLENVDNTADKDKNVLTAKRLVTTNITIKTGSTAQQKISLSTLMNWLINSEYIPIGSTSFCVIQTSWSYAGNDILQLTINNVNYELQLAGVIIEFMGTATAYDKGMFRLRIHSSPTVSFTSTNGYTKFPTSHIAEYICNGSEYTPNWRMISYLEDISVTSSGSGNAITSISYSNGVITANKGSTFLTSHQDISGKADKSHTHESLKRTQIATGTDLNTLTSPGEYYAIDNTEYPNAPCTNFTMQSIKLMSSYTFQILYAYSTNRIYTRSKIYGGSTMQWTSWEKHVHEDDLNKRQTLSASTTLSNLEDDRVYYINTADIKITLNSSSIAGLNITFISNKNSTIVYKNPNGGSVTKTMGVGTVLSLYSCGSGYTPNLYGTVLDINPSSTSVGQIYIKTK